MKITIAGTGFVGLSNALLAKALNTSAKNIERWLQQLKTQGLVEFRGAPKTGGYHATNYFNTKTIESVVADVLAINPSAVMVIKSTVPVGYTAKLKARHCAHPAPSLRTQ